MFNYSYIPAYVGNYTANRAAQGGSIKKITIHHMASNLTVEQLGNLWQTKGRCGSSHYGVQGNNVAQYVKEEDVAWTDSNWNSNINSITIETANCGGAPNWPVADNTINALIEIVADIAKRRNLGTLVVGKNLTYHSMYAATACPGPYLKGKLQYIADKANALNKTTPTPPPTPVVTYMLNVGPATEGDKNAVEKHAKSLGLPVTVTKK